MTEQNSHNKNSRLPLSRFRNIPAATARKISRNFITATAQVKAVPDLPAHIIKTADITPVAKAATQDAITKIHIIEEIIQTDSKAAIQDEIIRADITAAGTKTDLSKADITVTATTTDARSKADAADITTDAR